MAEVRFLFGELFSAGVGFLVGIGRGVAECENGFSDACGIGGRVDAPPLREHLFFAQVEKCGRFLNRPYGMWGFGAIR